LGSARRAWTPIPFPLALVLVFCLAVSSFLLSLHDFRGIRPPLGCSGVDWLEASLLVVSPMTSLFSPLLWGSVTFPCLWGRCDVTFFHCSAYVACPLVFFFLFSECVLAGITPPPDPPLPAHARPRSFPPGQTIPKMRFRR